MVIDERRIGEADGDVEAGRTKLLEVGWLAGFDESFVILAAVQGVGLQPLFAPGNAVSGRSRYDAVPSGRHVCNHRLAG